MGHKSRIFSVRRHQSPSYPHLLVSTSEDGTARVWHSESMRALIMLKHSSTEECLRACFLDMDEKEGAHQLTVATGGADGKIKVWWLLVESLHACEDDRIASTSKGELISPSSDGFMRNSRLKVDKCHTFTCPPPRSGDAGDNQVYALEAAPMLGPSKLMGASGESLFILDANADPGADNVFECRMHFSPGVKSNFGGDRNPSGMVFVFDAQPSPLTSGAAIAAVVLSDASLRLVDLSTMTEVFSAALLPPDLEHQAHATSSSWSDDGLQLAVALSTGDALIVNLTDRKVSHILKGHQRPCYGAAFLHRKMGSKADRALGRMIASSAGGASDSPLVFTWSSDGTLNLHTLTEGINQPHMTYQGDSPILACEYASEVGFICAGGDNSGSAFLGCPFHTISFAESQAAI